MFIVFFLFFLLLIIQENEIRIPFKSNVIEHTTQHIKSSVIEDTTQHIKSTDYLHCINRHSTIEG